MARRLDIGQGCEGGLTYLQPMRMRDAWTKEAPNWLQLVRRHLDAGWALSRPHFLELVPPPGELTLDIGCGRAAWPGRSRGRASRNAPVSAVVADAALPFGEASRTSWRGS
jgi:hypothetical protein